MTLRLKRIRAFVLLLAIALSVLSPLAAHAQSPAQKVVRVDWYESPFNFSACFGRRSGYASDYQQKIAAYTG